MAFVKGRLPGMVQNTGMPVRSTSSFSSSVAPANNTPRPAQSTGFFAVRSAVTASLMSPDEGTCCARFGE